MADPTDRLVEVVRAFGGDELRDVWLFDQWTHQRLFVRRDVADVLDDVDIDVCIDNERYGFVTRETYETLYYADYEYTLRGFSEFVQFRTFLDDGETRVGVIASFDRSGGLDPGTLYADLTDLREEFAVSEFTPVRTED
ncbi:hypothetical protein ACFO0N_14175 [Halobium salinum]|uniref:Uncharacterized protein n=1 Tax=Halobium salinum TaxID=1364940 RepID=A0ABD5PEA2_9EURY|nr:hypothetical protein [Halobium salinum]